MKVEILEENGIKHGNKDGILEVFNFGDIRTVPDDVGEYFCALGWAKDVDGKTPTAERDISRKALFVEGASAKTKVKKANG